MQWKFKPLQDEIYVSPGETALAFFTGKFKKILYLINFLKPIIQQISQLLALVHTICHRSRLHIILIRF